MCWSLNQSMNCCNVGLLGISNRSQSVHSVSPYYRASALHKHQMAVAHLLLGSLYRLREPKEGESQVHKAVFVVLQLVLAVNDLSALASFHARCKARPTLYSSKHTRPTAKAVVVAIAGMILPAINLVLCLSAWVIP